MERQVSEYRDNLESALRRLGPHISAGRIVGSDAAQFLVVDRGDRGVEIYGDERSGVTIDPALDQDLQGEISFPTFDLALNAAVRWLYGATMAELLTHSGEAKG